MHSFFCQEINEKGSIAELDKRDSKHLFKTLRARPGDEVQLIDGKGRTATGTITQEGLISISDVSAALPPPVKVHLFVAPPRKQKMDHLLRQCVETGLWSLTAMICERSVSIPDADSVPERWDVIALEACKQSANPFFPDIRTPMKFSDAVKSLSSAVIKLYGSPTGSWEIPSVPAGESADIAWFVGPEGGFSPAEEKLMDDAGFSKIRIGPHIMRVETAAVCGTALLVRNYRDPVS